MKDGKSEVLFIHSKRKMNACLPHPTNTLQLIRKKPSDLNPGHTKLEKDTPSRLKVAIRGFYLHCWFFLIENNKLQRAKNYSKDRGVWILASRRRLPYAEQNHSSPRTGTWQSCTTVPVPDPAPLSPSHSPKGWVYLFCSLEVNKSTLTHT